MNAEKLNKWADLLLDTGKRNNLINFKDSKTGTVEVVSPDFATLFSKAEHSALFEVYDPKLEDEEELFEPSEQETSERAKEKPLSKDEYICAYQKKLKKQQILVYNPANKPISALKNISKRAKTALEETGVNIAYMAFGFIHWTENETPQLTLRAPILLVPVTIENESSIEPYRVKIMGDETIVNPTFSFKLQNEYGIKFPTFDEDEGVERYFSKIEELISRLKWSVSTECKIGIFSFLKINMYKDLKDNAEKIVEHTSVRALLGERYNEPAAKEKEPAFDLLDLHNVVDADSSQAEAIEMARNGTSFVLQGPPGTGKSQTITNVIAECLLNDKKVLFVSEKLAALNVVYEKLKNAGLEEFCLELHSHKANKKQVIDELCHTLKLSRSGVSDQAEKELRAKKEAQQKLDEYAAELHKPHPIINKTLYRLYEEISACRHAPDMEFVVQDIKTKGEEYIEKAENALLSFEHYTPSVGYDYRQNVWYGYTSLDASYATVMQVKSDFLAIAELCKSLQELADTLSEKYEISASTLTQAHVFQEFFALVKESGFITPALFAPSTLHKTLETVKRMQETAKTVLSQKAILDETFDEEIFQLDGAALYKKLTKEFSSFPARLFSREYRQIARDMRLCKKDGKRLSYPLALSALKTLQAYQQKSKEFAKLQNPVEPLLGDAYQGANTDFARCFTELEALSLLLSKGVSLKKLTKLSKNQFILEQPLFAEISKGYNEAFAKIEERKERFISYFNLKEYDLLNVSIRSLHAKLSGCVESIDNLDNWCAFIKLLELLKALELRPFVDLAIKKKVQTDKIALAYKKAFYTQWVDAILRESPTLSYLARVPHDETVKRFKEKDELHFEINKAKIKASLSARRPKLDMIAQGSSISLLLRESEKKRKQKGIRVLLSEIGELAQTLKPCFLMSPLSVSTYLTSDMKFDVVIFDEASQIFPQDAVGAIYRGKQLIVVGDSKQMPPSNFFHSSAETDTDDDEAEDITDFESILDLCATSFPQRRLKWHYRSRYEQLISFSNKNFYDNELVTFPSSKRDKAGIGVDYVHVDGVFDRKTKTNLVEAEKIVDMIFEHIENYPERSLGVVAFSISQQTLIDKLLSRRRQQNPSKEVFFKSDKIEPFFIKNLETVQGDERDTILFSIAYAKDAQGKLLHNFGPVNREGGERRLNVAVTRAKHNVKLVSSLHYTDIDLSGAKSNGARLLREYLDYAENGEIALKRATNISPFEANESEFEREVGEFLEENGYFVDRQVGCSSFKIDLAVKASPVSDYAIAIECDGEDYREAKTARDRDRLRQEVLERMTWSFYRVWSTDWFRNKRLEKERLLSAVKQAFERTPSRAQTQKTPDGAFEKTVEETSFEFPKYEQADEVSLHKQLNFNPLDTIRAILEKEAPLSEEWLLKRIVFMFGGREKVTSVVQDYYNRVMWDSKSAGIIRRDGFLYLQGKEIPMLRVPAKGSTPREIKYIAVEELANGLREVLKRNVSVEKAGLFKLIVEELGFARMGDTISAQLERALQSIANELDVNGETLSLK